MLGVGVGHELTFMYCVLGPAISGRLSVKLGGLFQWLSDHLMQYGSVSPNSAKHWAGVW